MKSLFMPMFQHSLSTGCLFHCLLFGLQDNILEFFQCHSVVRFQGCAECWYPKIKLPLFVNLKASTMDHYFLCSFYLFDINFAFLPRRNCGVLRTKNGIIYFLCQFSVTLKIGWLVLSAISFIGGTVLAIIGVFSQYEFMLNTKDLTGRFLPRCELLQVSAVLHFITASYF